MMSISRNLIATTKLGQRIKDVFQKFDNYFDNVIKSNIQNNNNNMLENTAIDILLDPKNEFTEEEIKDELIMMLLGVSLFSL